MRYVIPAAAFFAVAVCMKVEAIELGMPLDCVIGQTCMVQNYVDADPGEGAKDFECGPLAYDNHQGTDFRLLSRSEISKGFEAIATAPGRIISTIDNQPDHHFRDAQDDPFGCGNAVMIDHGDGWVSQYCHLAKGSLKVSRTQMVKKGQPLGYVGSSGGTDFPHLHYAIRRFGAVINPFTGVSPTGCEAAKAKPLWDPALELEYVPSAVFGYGVSGVFPSLEIVKNDHGQLTPPKGKIDPFYIWLHVLGIRESDSVRMIAFGPDGKPFASELFKPGENKTIYLVNIGVAPEDLDVEEWPEGEYTARITIYDQGEEILSEDIKFSLPQAKT